MDMIRAGFSLDQLGELTLGQFNVLTKAQARYAIDKRLTELSDLKFTAPHSKKALDKAIRSLAAKRKKAELP